MHESTCTMFNVQKPPHSLLLNVLICNFVAVIAAIYLHLQGCLSEEQLSPKSRSLRVLIALISFPGTAVFGNSWGSVSKQHLELSIF